MFQQLNNYSFTTKILICNVINKLLILRHDEIEINTENDLTQLLLYLNTENIDFQVAITEVIKNFPYNSILI